jgi:hypothetical protein
MSVRAAVALGIVATLAVAGFFAGAWLEVDPVSTSTAYFAYFFIPLWGLAAIIVIWCLVWWEIRRNRWRGLPAGSEERARLERLRADERARAERLRWEAEQRRLWRESRQR